MKLFKKTIFSIFGMALLATGFVACSSDDSNNTQQEIDTQKSTMSINENYKKIGEVVNDVATPYFKYDDFKREFTKYNLMAEVESIKINKNNLTIIGKDKQDFSLVAMQFKLTRIDNTLYFPVKGAPTTIYAEHKCDGSSCSSCAFKENKDGDIIGCNCHDGGICNHTVSDDDDGVTLDDVKKVVEIISTIVETVIPFI